MDERRHREHKRKQRRKEFFEFFADAGDFDDDEVKKTPKERKRSAFDADESPMVSRGTGRHYYRGRNGGIASSRDISSSERRNTVRHADSSEDDARLGESPRYEGGNRAGERRRAKPATRREHKKKSAVPVIIVLLMLLIIGGAFAGKYYLDKYSYSKVEMPLEEYFNVSGVEDIPLIINDDISSVHGMMRDGQVYLPLSFVNENLNPRFYFDKVERAVLYTTPTQLFVFNEGSASYSDFISGESYTAAAPVWITGWGEPCIEVSFLSKYANFICERYENPTRLQLYLENTQANTARIDKDTSIRYQGGVKSDVLIPVSGGEKVFVLEELENWDKVRFAGVTGYVEKKYLQDFSTESITVPTAYTTPVYSSLTRDHRINMAWHQVTNATANNTVYELLENTQAVNVISPTWYFLSDDNGGFTTIADAGYVSDMHSRGLEVWALIDNFTNKVDTAAVVGSLSNRQRLIAELVSSVVSIGADGINVDFELVPSDAGADYVEFIRELSIRCRMNNLVLSVDNYVPTDYSDYYDRGEQGVVADYVVIMGYDEHYSGSPEAGSVSSLGYVQSGIERTLSEVPANKVINGIPFYTRFWRTGGGEVTSEALTMNGGIQSLEKRGITPEWDDTTSQYYAGFDEDGKFCQIWLEEDESIRAKLKIMSQYNLGGVAEWKLGQEKASVWNEIAAYMSGEIESR